VCRLHSVHDDEKPFELELSWVCEDSQNEFKQVPAELVAEANAAAKAALADSDM
jgi:20S proteasome subunit alpha 7